MEVGKDKMISVTYVLRETDFSGKIIEEVNDANPLQFVFDTGKLIKKFEENLAGKNMGDEFEFLLKSEDAYGEYSEDKIMPLPKQAFEVNGKIDEDVIVVGASVPMQDKQGNKLIGLIVEITDKIVKMDFNHPMAGKTLAYKGKITEVRETTELERNAHLYGHDASQCSSCGGGCG